MTFALLGRELVVIGRRRAVWCAMAAQTAFMTTAFVVWGAGLPGAQSSAFEQLTLMHLASAALVIPWIAARCALDGPRDLAARAAITAAPAARVLAAQIAALHVLALAYLASAVPIILVCARGWQVDGLGILSAVAPAVCLAVFAATAVPLLRLYGSSRAGAWLLTTLVSTAVLLAVPAQSWVAAYLGGAVLCSMVAITFATPRLAEIWPPEFDTRS